MPVIDPTNNVVVDIYSRNMVVMLGKDSTADSLLRTVGETVSSARESREFFGFVGWLLHVQPVKFIASSYNDFYQCQSVSFGLC